MSAAVSPEVLLARIDDAHRTGNLSQDAAENAKDWVAKDVAGDDHDAINALLDTSDGVHELENLFWQRIPFGTGGRRGLMSDFGTATINRRTIAESAHGLAVYLKQATGKSGGSAIVAHDTRNRSPEFAKITAETFAAHGLRVFLFADYRSTPELSFAVRHLDCDVGVMITASHNPPSDNGFKAYWNTGGQVLAPHDAGIIKCVEAADEIPTPTPDDLARIEKVGKEIDEAYWQAVLSMSLSDARDVPALYSPLHGVGETVCWEILVRGGFLGIEIFEPQRTPDGNFPNVPDQLPNPERKAVFEPMFAHAKSIGAKLLMASDPDADRLAACVWNDERDEFVHLSGNQVGALLVDYILRKRADRGDLTPKHYVVETLVTTRLIGAIARAHNVRVIDDLLVGFKYIGQTMDAEGPDLFVFGAEESLGYLAGTYARDKDAGIAALYLAECAAELRLEEKTLLDRLDELYFQHGVFAESQVSKTCPGAEGNRQIAALMQAFRETPPSGFSGLTFDVVHDYGAHETRSLPANSRKTSLPEPQGDLLIFESQSGERGLRLAVRPSGTEPKIKFYLFARVPCADAVQSAKDAADRLLDDVATDLQAWLDARLA